MDGFDPDEVARFRIAVGRIGKGVDRQVDAGDLTRTQTSVLATVARLGPLGAGELAQHEGLNPTMLSRVVGKLETHGLLSRSPDPADKRVARLSVTAAGRTLHRRLRRDRTTVFARALEQIGPGHAAALRTALPALEALSLALAPTAAAVPTATSPTAVASTATTTTATTSTATTTTTAPEASTPR